MSALRAPADDRPTVLVLTYRFPPQGGGGVQRTLKAVKYLSRSGWRPVVHTVSNPHWPLRDEGLSREIPDDVPVYRTPTLEFERFEARLGDFLDRLRRRGRHGATASPGGARPAGDTAGGRPSSALDGDGPAPGRGLVARLQDRVWRHVLIPDPQIAWLPGALLRSLWIARQEGAQVLYSSSPPNSINVLALQLQQRLGIPWVADMRDPWTDGLRRRQWYAGNPGRQRLEERWEREIFERADHVLVTTDAGRDAFLQKYPQCRPEKLTLMTNGFDPEDFAHVHAENRFLEPGMMHLTLTGNVETMFDAMPFFAAVAELVEADPEARRILRVNFVGTKRQARYDRFLEDRKLGDVVRFHGYVPHADSVQYLAESQAVMLCQIPRYESAVVKVPGKLFEYLFLRRPVLALTIPGVTTRILERARLGRIVAPDDQAGIRDALRQFVAEFRSGGIRTEPDEEYVATFDRKLQATRLAGILSEVVHARQTTA